MAKLRGTARVLACNIAMANILRVLGYICVYKYNSALRYTFVDMNLTVIFLPSSCHLPVILYRMPSLLSMLYYRYYCVILAMDFQQNASDIPVIYMFNKLRLVTSSEIVLIYFYLGCGVLYRDSGRDANDGKKSLT